ncbi:TPA: hypothetical protein N0F65_006268 [Lagenidium giganteum]|uniref:Uncharacterized protein n=1 Tax=Lagenidium giganteum TaxID=4803 RepID=A0AAV2Z5J3_9STRA|nr:TPA: hypothetical protein N0F65_006268 [Lagenidium giganteum]
MNSPSNTEAHKQLSCFVSMQDDDELTQLILEELSMPRRSYVNVLAGMASPPSLQRDVSLNSIKEDIKEEA